jgi:hypothetical protein
VRKRVFVVVHIKMVSLDPHLKLLLCLCIQLQFLMDLLDAVVSQGKLCGLSIGIDSGDVGHKLSLHGNSL